MEVFENPISCILIGFVAGFAACYALGIIRFDMSIRVGRQKKTFSVHQDDKSSDKFSEVEQPVELDRRKMEFARWLVVNGYISDQQ
jgi:hypothetical protein